MKLGTMLWLRRARCCSTSRTGQGDAKSCVIGIDAWCHNVYFCCYRPAVVFVAAFVVSIVGDTYWNLVLTSHAANLPQVSRSEDV